MADFLIVVGEMERDVKTHIPGLSSFSVAHPVEKSVLATVPDSLALDICWMSHN